MKALSVVNKLSPAPTTQPQYFVEVKNSQGQIVKLGDPKVTRALVALMDQHAVIGGAAAHWGGPAAYAEMSSALHQIMFSSISNGKQWYENYHFVNDAGHAENGIYALRANLGFDHLTFDDLRKFRSIESKLTGHGEAHLNPEGVYISNGPLGSGLPQAQGLAIADKLLGNDRATICIISDGACMEGEAKEAMAAIPGLAHKGKLNPFVMIVSDNNTKLGGRISDDSFDMKNTFDSLSTLGFEVIHLEDGHDIQAVYTCLEKAIQTAKQNSNKAVALVIKTIKGYGVKSTEQSASGGHGYPLGAYDDKLPAFIDEIFKGETPEYFSKWAHEILSNKPEKKASNPNAKPTDKVQTGVAEALIRACEEGLPIYSVSSDLGGSTGIKAFQQKFPNNFLDVGIAESNMISTAIGLSKAGFIPVVDTFAQFGVTKGNLPLIMSQLSGGPVICLFSHTGFQDAADGASHQATTYFSAVAGIPNTTVISLSCKAEASDYMYQAIKKFEAAVKAGKTPETTIFFFGRENHPISYTEKTTFEWARAQVLREGRDGVVVTSGPLVQEALSAAETLATKGVELTIINNPFINKVDVETISAQLKKNKNKLITLEDHQLIAGAGSILVHSLKLNGDEFSVTSLANLGHFGQSAYQAKQLYTAHKMDSNAIIELF